MKKINYYFVDTTVSKNNLCAKYKLVDFIFKEKKNAKEINFIFCKDDYLQRINEKYLQHTNLTDVITFDHSQGKKLIGDIYISVERVKENASKFGTTLKSELIRVMIHGVLHLIGYNDKSKVEKKCMRKMENKFLKRVL
ncbi:MAG: rRNA maturation RNase YbeY [Flavobacteriales bacterium]|nr:rRNA maturation RNase YbeY [Flavobacteriales bacterium]|tara:strand:- start:1933 stop:2349 length:417 start_codon:yes stop_codon:yes gene_type:complete